MRILFGIFIGIVIATVGLTGLANLVDSQVNKLQETIKETAK
jgi:hypothetical protein